MDIPAGRSTAPPAGSPSPRLRDREEAEGYVAMVCFKHGPPRLHGIELEWTVHHRDDPGRPLAASQLTLALGDHAPRSLHPQSTERPLAAGSLVTVEPGGQVEISAPPSPSPADLIALTSADAATLADLLARQGLVLGRRGTDPDRPPTRLLHTPRYDAMQAAFDPIGPEGARMMCSTASVQVCLDAGETGQIPNRWRAAHAIGPALVALFANSPDLTGGPTGWASSRLRATLGTYPPSTMPPAPTDDPAQQWARTAIEAPVICVRTDGPSWAPPRGLTFAGWINEPASVGRPPTVEDLDYHLTTLFPPVRPKGYLEIRYLDAQPGSGWATPFALLAALMARPATIDRALDLSEQSAGRWYEAGRDGLADPVLREGARDLAKLGIDRLDDLGLTTAQRTQVADDLTNRLEMSPTTSRCSV